MPLLFVNHCTEKAFCTWFYLPPARKEWFCWGI